VCNYDKYQVTNKQDNKVLTNNQQTPNNQLTTIEERKEIKNIRSNIYALPFGEKKDASKTNKNGFHNFENRDYDTAFYESLETLAVQPK